jgi:predicted PurR-regulated permease PerM
MVIVVVTPVVAFYLLLDWDHFVARIDGWLPRGHAPVIRRLAARSTRCSRASCAGSRRSACCSAGSTRSR